jgi:uncharacterized protein
MPLYESQYDYMLRGLQNLVRENADIEAAILVTADGLFISSFPDIEDQYRMDLIAASSAAGASLAASLIDTTNREGPGQVYIEGERGYIVLVPLFKETVLVVLARKEAQIGLIFLDIPRNFLARASEPILPPRPPKSLSARAEPAYDDDDL